MYVYMFPPKGPEVICNAVYIEREGSWITCLCCCVMHYALYSVHYLSCACPTIHSTTFFGSFYWIVPIFPGCSTVATPLHESFTESTFFLSQIFLLVAKQDSFPHSTLADMTLFNTMTSHKNILNHRMCCELASLYFFIDKVS